MKRKRVKWANVKERTKSQAKTFTICLTVNIGLVTTILLCFSVVSRELLCFNFVHVY